MTLIGLAALASMATSSVESGERANDDDVCIIDCEDEGPICPAGEECSDDTPTGLYFGGMRTGDLGLLGTEWPHATAVGGRQRIRIFLDRDGEQPLNLPFDADFTTSALSIAGQSGASVTLRGESSGGGRLRILEPGTDLLYDRIQLEAAAAGELQLVPAGRATLNDAVLLDDATAYAVAVGGRARITAAIYATDGTRVVDEDIAIDRVAQVRPDPEGFADTVELAPTSAGVIPVTVRAGTLEQTASVRAVTAPDEIVSPWGAEPLGLTVGQSRQFCFAARSAGDYVLGASWAYGATPGVSVADDPEADYISDCVVVTGDQVGTATLTVTASGGVASFLVEVADDTRSTSARTADVAPIEPQLAGERAEYLQ